jgi:hypothetical protein
MRQKMVYTARAWPRVGDVWAASKNGLIDEAHDSYAKVVVDKVYIPLGSNETLVKFLLLDGTPTTWAVDAFTQRFYLLDP